MPKSLNEIRQKKIIEMIFEKLKLLGIKDIYLTVGYKSKKLFNFLNLRNLNLRLFILKILETVVLFIAGILFIKHGIEKKISFCYIVIYFSITHI